MAYSEMGFLVLPQIGANRISGVGGGFLLRSQVSVVVHVGSFYLKIQVL